MKFSLLTAVENNSLFDATISTIKIRQIQIK
jgi:hypothetical protein